MKNYFIIALMLVVLPGCSVVVKRVGGSFSTSLSQTIMNHNDLETVKAAAPSYMLILDSLVRKNPNDADAFVQAASLYSAYASLFVAESDKPRAKRLIERAYNYSQKALCLEVEKLCAAASMPFEDYQAALLTKGPKAREDILFNVGSVWASWIQINQADWAAVAQLPKVKALVNFVLQQNESYGNGQAQMYMGVLEAILPPSAGGDLEKAQAHFLKAKAFSEGKNLLVNVLYAQNYARMVFDQDLHDALLKEVLAADPMVEGFTLMNTIAQNEAQKLLASSNEYFN